MQKKTLKGNLLLLLTAAIWGAAFVSQRVGMEYIGPNTFNGLRTLLGALVLIPLILIREKRNSHRASTQKTDYKHLLIGGVICGILMCIASTLQTWGMVYTTSGKSGFITAMYMIFVPILGLFVGKRIRGLTILGIAAGVVGLYLLTMSGSSLSLNIGDLMTLGSAVIFAAHILMIDRLTREVDGVKLAFLQFLVSGTINVIFMFLLEHPDLDLIFSCAIPILYAGVLSCGVGYTLQIIAQRYAEPAPAAILMSLESVFALLTGWLILKEVLRPGEILGCVLMFAAIIIVQLPHKSRSDTQ